MKLRLLKLITIILLFSTFTITSAEVFNNYQFISPIQSQRFARLLSELRCLVCQNQSLSESNAPLAQDLKKQVYLQIREGLTDDQIKHYLVQRYGEYILFKPSLNRVTLILWLGPLFFLVGSFCILLISMRRNRKIQNDNLLQVEV